MDVPRRGRRARAGPPPWAPLMHTVFRNLWLAQFVANTGTWAQTVGAQWLMGDVGGSTLELALVQTATTLPVFVLVVPAGALGDILDRRRQLIAGQSVLLMGAAALSVLTALRATSPGSLLALTAAMAVGQALSVPVFQAIQSELVERDEIAQAALLNAANANIARAVGPALGGLLIAVTGPETTFAVNALSFLGVLGVLLAWRRPRTRRPHGAERMIAAVRAGARYVRSAPAFSTVLARSALFMIFASALWSLLPAVARGPLELDAGGYGILLGCVGGGALLGTFVLPSMRAIFGEDKVVVAGMAGYGVMMALTGLATSLPAVVIAMVFAGVSWISVLSTLNASAQLLLPSWTRARALAYYQLVFMGGQALGALMWGLVADQAGLVAAFVTPAAGLVLAAAWTAWRLPLGPASYDLTRSRHWPAAPAADAVAGPVLVVVEWPIAPEQQQAFVRAMRPVGWARRRTGATLWGLFRDVESPNVFLEVFTVATWTEHLRQHDERNTELDRELDARVTALLAPGATPRVRHLSWAASSHPGWRVLGKKPR
jgi:MFS family permease